MRTYDRSLKPPCYKSHPILKIGGGEILGASCVNPRDGFDVYIGLDSMMILQSNTYPWSPSQDDAPMEVLFRIKDGCAPKDAKNFKLMVEWIAERLSLGKRVHVGCIGGHGRTGTVLAAVVKRVLGEKDAVGWLRKNYCSRAVESKSQVNFLRKHYAIDTVEPAKSPRAKSLYWSDKDKHESYGKSLVSASRPVHYAENDFNIWGI